MIKRMKKDRSAYIRFRILIAAAIFLSICLQVGQAGAVTFDEINDPSIFLKQINGDKRCTLVAATMLVRRASILTGNPNWSEITVDKLSDQAWVKDTGLKWTFTYEGITVTRETFGANPVEEATQLLSQHPEGIVIYDKNRYPGPHAVLLTDNNGDNFYYADPAETALYGRISETDTTVRVKDAEYYWYVSSPMIAPLTAVNTVETEQPNQAYIENEHLEKIDNTVVDAAISRTGFPNDKFSDIKVEISKSVIKKGKSAKIYVVLPDSLMIVQSFSYLPDQEGHEIMICYASENSDIAAVSKEGKITGKKKGKTNINIIASMENGTCKIFSFQIKIK